MECIINWGDVATWFTGIITLGLFIIGFWQIRNDRLLRLKSDEEIEIRHRRNQAEHVSSWINIAPQDGSLFIAILNQSHQPVYQVIVTIVLLGQESKPRQEGPEKQVYIAIAPPGKGYARGLSGVAGMHRYPGVEIAFKDAAGTNWIRKSNGELLEIEISPIEYYKIMLPIGWIELEKEIPSDRL